MKLNYKILLILTLLMLISLNTLFSIGKIEYFYRNLLFWIISFLIIFSSLILKYDALLKTSLFYLFYILSLLALISTFLVPSKERIWIQIGSFNFQPSEFARIIFIITLAIFISKYYHLLNNNFYLFLSFLVILPFLFIIFLQPDLGMFLIYFLTWLISVSFFLSPSKIFKLGFLIIVFISLIWFFGLKDYQKERILNFINPYRDPLKSGYNLIQLRITLGSAGLLGKGPGQNTQARLGFLPSSHTDFILASFIEERGAVGLALYIFLILFLLSVLYKENKFIKDPLAIVFTNILIIHLTIRFLITVGINLSIFPIIGLAVPFLSYGGSHLISDAILIAIWHSLRYKEIV